MTANQDTPPDDGFRKYIQDHALLVADSLNALTPSERSLVLHEADKIWKERRLQERNDAPDDAFFEMGQWLARVFQRLSHPAQAGLIEVAKRLDEAERFDRLVESEE